MTISHRPHILKMRTKALKILKHEPILLCLSTCRQLKLHQCSAQLETLLLVLSVVDFVFLQKLCVFLPKDFRLLLKTVGPGQQHQHRRHIQIHIPGLQKPKQFVRCMTNLKWNVPPQWRNLILVAVTLTWPSLWIHCKFPQ